MATLSARDRADVNRDFQATLSQDRETMAGCLKTDIAAAINAADDWLNTNAASFNSALPAAARNGLTAAQKARLLVFCIKKRFDKGA